MNTIETKPRSDRATAIIQKAFKRVQDNSTHWELSAIQSSLEQGDFLPTAVNSILDSQGQLNKANVDKAIQKVSDSDSSYFEDIKDSDQKISKLLEYTLVCFLCRVLSDLNQVLYQLKENDLTDNGYNEFMNTLKTSFKEEIACNIQKRTLNSIQHPDAVQRILMAIRSYFTPSLPVHFEKPLTQPEGIVAPIESLIYALQARLVIEEDEDAVLIVEKCAKLIQLYEQLILDTELLKKIENTPPESDLISHGTIDNFLSNDDIEAFKKSIIDQVTSQLRSSEKPIAIPSNRSGLFCFTHRIIHSPVRDKTIEGAIPSSKHAS